MAGNQDQDQEQWCNKENSEQISNQSNNRTIKINNDDDVDDYFHIRFWS